MYIVYPTSLFITSESGPNQALPHHSLVQCGLVACGTVASTISCNDCVYQNVLALHNQWTSCKISVNSY